MSLSSEDVALVVDDATADSEPPLPQGFEFIGRVVHWNQTPSFTDVAALLEPRQEVKPGQFLGVWHGRRGLNLLTVVQVANSFEVNPNEVPDLAAAREVLGLGRGYGQEGVSTRIFRLAECATTEEFDLREDAGTWRVTGDGRAPGTLARAGDCVVLLPPEITIQTIGGKPDPESGVFVGQTYGTEPVDVTLTPEILQLHVGIFGNPGKGKSYLAGNLIEESVSWGIPTLVLDINGEMIEAAKALNGLVITLPNPEQFGISLNLMTPAELVSVTPNVQQGTVYAELIELAHDRLRNEARGNRITFSQLRDRIAELGDSSKAAKTSIGAAIARVSVLERDPLIGGDFDFVAQLIKNRIVVLDCRFLSLRETQLIAAAGARELQRIGREMARRAEDGDAEAAKWFAAYFVDEAHAVVPDDERVVSTQVHFELARMGRHVRTGMVLSSQSPQDLNTSVLKRLQTRFVFALEKDQLRSIQGVLADLDDKILNQLPKLPRGVCAVSGSGELVRHGFLARVRERRTPVGGRTPSVFEGRRKSKIRGN
jgi:DNA helicase HerA-like ATPase